MRALTAVAEAIAGTTRKTEKVRLLAAYFQSRPVEEAAVSAVFLSGRAFPACEEITLQVGGAQLWRVIGHLSRKSEAMLTAAYRRHGDLGAAAGEVLRSVAPAEGQLSVLDVAQAFRAIGRALRSGRQVCAGDGPPQTCHRARSQVSGEDHGR